MLFKTDKSRPELVKEWKDVIDLKGKNIIKGKSKRENLAMLCESQKNFLAQNFKKELVNENTTTSSPGFETYLKLTIPMVRRIFPELICNDLVGVQPMAGPVGLAFAMRYRYGDTIGGINAGDEAGFSVIDPRYSGTGDNAYGTSANGGLDNYDGGKAFDTADAELVGDDWTNYQNGGSYKIPEMELSVEVETITAGTRKLKAAFTLEIQQDLANVHNIDIDKEMVSMLSYQIQAEIDREMVGRMVASAVNSGYVSSWTPDSGDGRWMAEVFTTLYYQILIEANSINITTRRGTGNFIIASPTAVSALQTLDIFQFYPIKNTINTQESGVSKVGQLDGRLTVYVDTFATNDYILVGYKGREEWDAGIIYCPYIPLLISRTQGEDDFMPRIGLMTRYGVSTNILNAGQYYRVIKLDFSQSSRGVYPTVEQPFGYDANNVKRPAVAFPNLPTP